MCSIAAMQSRHRLPVAYKFQVSGFRFQVFSLVRGDRQPEIADDVALSESGVGHECVGHDDGQKVAARSFRIADRLSAQASAASPAQASPGC